MSWIYLDDGFADHPKIIAITDSALRLELGGLCYSNRHLTDGHIPLEYVGRRLRQAQNLVDHELWIPDGSGWTIHDYLDYNKSAKRVRAQRAAAAERKRLERERERDQKPEDVTP